jgi:hypothetical protein
LSLCSEAKRRRSCRRRATGRATPAGPIRATARQGQEAKHEIRQVLDKYAARYDVDPGEVGRLVRGYVDDLLGDLFYERENELLDGMIEWTRTEPATIRRLKNAAGAAM